MLHQMIQIKTVHMSIFLLSSLFFTVANLICLSGMVHKNMNCNFQPPSTPIFLVSPTTTTNQPPTTNNNNNNGRNKSCSSFENLSAHHGPKLTGAIFQSKLSTILEWLKLQDYKVWH
jgi:hypothetical protein